MSLAFALGSAGIGHLLEHLIKIIQGYLRPVVYDVAFKSREGTWLVLGDDGTFVHVQSEGNGLPPEEAFVAYRNRYLRKDLTRLIFEASCARDMRYLIRGMKILRQGVICNRWNSSRPLTIQFKSPMAGVFSATGLETIFSGQESRPSANKFCLVPCDAGTLEFVPEFECRNWNHIWTAYFFDSRTGIVLHPPTIYPTRDMSHMTSRYQSFINCFGRQYHTNVGGNYNCSVGTQIIGAVNIVHQV